MLLLLVASAASAACTGSPRTGGLPRFGTGTKLRSPLSGPSLRLSVRDVRSDNAPCFRLPLLASFCRASSSLVLPWLWLRPRGGARTLRSSAPRSFALRLPSWASLTASAEPPFPWWSGTFSRGKRHGADTAVVTPTYSKNGADHSLGEEAVQEDAQCGTVEQRKREWGRVCTYACACPRARVNIHGRMLAGDLDDKSSRSRASTRLISSSIWSSSKNLFSSFGSTCSVLNAARAMQRVRDVHHNLPLRTHMLMSTLAEARTSFGT
jgi:hypothetical protein